MNNVPPIFLKLQDDGHTTINIVGLLYYGVDDDRYSLRMKWENDSRTSSVNFSYYHSRKHEEDIARLNKIFEKAFIG